MTETLGGSWTRTRAAFYLEKVTARTKPDVSGITKVITPWAKEQAQLYPLSSGLPTLKCLRVQFLLMNFSLKPPCNFIFICKIIWSGKISIKANREQNWVRYLTLNHRSLKFLKKITKLLKFMYIGPQINKDYVLDFCYKELFVWGSHA